MVRWLGLLIGQFLILAPVGGGALMLMLGIAHYEASEVIPALDFWTCLALVALASFVKSAVAPSFPDEE